MAVAASQFYGFAGGGSLYILELDDLFNVALIEQKKYEWADGLFDLVSSRSQMIIIILWVIINRIVLSFQAWSPACANLLLSGSGDGSVQLWNIDEDAQKPIQVYRDHLKEIYSVNWSRISAGSFITSSWDTTLKLFDVNSSVPLSTYHGHTDLAFCATFSPFNKNSFASVSCDGTLKLWDIGCPSRSIMTVRDADNAELLSCDWSNLDPNMIVTGGSDGFIHGFDIRKMTKAVFELDGCESAVRRVQCAYDAPYRVAATSFDHSTRVWNAQESSEPTETFFNHSEFTYGLDWSPFNRNLLVDCGWDSLVHVFSIKGKEC